MRKITDLEDTGYATLTVFSFLRTSSIFPLFFCSYLERTPTWTDICGQHLNSYASASLSPVKRQGVSKERINSVFRKGPLY